MRTEKWMRAWAVLVALPFFAGATAQAAFTVNPNGSILLRAADPAIAYMDHADFSPAGDTTQFSQQLIRYYSDRVPSATTLETARRDELAISTCMNKCGATGHCAILGTFPDFEAANLFGIMAGSYRYTPYTIGCSLPSRSALAAFEHAANFGSAMNLCPNVEGTRAETMCSLVTADVFATLLVAREAGYDSSLVDAVLRARSLMPLQMQIEFGETSAAIRKAAVEAAEDNPRLSNPSIYDQLIGGIFTPLIDPPTPYKQNCLENSAIFTTSAWRILQPRFALLRQPLMNKAKDAFEEKPRQMDVGYPSMLPRVNTPAAGNAGNRGTGTATTTEIKRPRLATGCFSQRTNDMEYTDWELLELILAGEKPELLTVLNKLIASIESEDRALYIKAQQIAKDFVWSEEEITEAADVLMQAEIRYPVADTATAWMARLATIDPLDTYSPTKAKSADIPMPETLRRLRDELGRSLAACGGP